MLPTKEELQQRYASHANERLLSIVHNAQEYTAEALEVAKAELQLRNVSTEEVKAFVEEKETEALMEKLALYVPLSFWEKALFFIAWFLPWFFGGAIRMNYAEDGLVLKFKQSRLFSIAGFVSMFLYVFIGVYFELNSLSAISLYVFFLVSFFLIEPKIKYHINQ